MPVVVEDPVYYDEAPPPFTWVFNGDDGTSFTDPNELEEPDFVLEPADNYEQLYPRFTEMLKNLKTFVKENPKVLSALQRWSGFSKQEILNHLTYGQGPTIKVEEMSGRYAWYKKEPGSNILRVRASYVRGLEIANLDKLKKVQPFFWQLLSYMSTFIWVPIIIIEARGSSTLVSGLNWNLLTSL